MTDWLLCDGRSLRVDEYPDLFDLIGYAYGGRGETFKIPDLLESGSLASIETNTAMVVSGNEHFPTIYSVHRRLEQNG